jgi:diacylglycerol kinase (ATP)
MFVIANPAARLVGRVALVGDVVEQLLAAGASPRVALTRGPEDACRLAQEAVTSGVDRIVVVGGDGTINEVVQVIAHSSVELAVVPMGTGNVVGRYLKLRPGELSEACQLAVHGVATPVDLGVMGTRYFAGMAGAGLDAEIVDKISRPWKEIVGWLAFAGQAIQAVLTDEPRYLQLHFDEGSFEGPMWGVLISNLPEYTYRMELSSLARPDDGLLDFVILHDQGYVKLLDFGLDTFVWGESVEAHHAATVVQAARLQIEADEPVKWQVDGEMMGVTPVVCRVEPAALQLVSRLPENGDSAATC